MKKTPYVVPKTGEYNLKYNIQNILEAKDRRRAGPTAPPQGLFLYRVY